MLQSRFGMPFWITVPTAGIVAAVVGVIFGLPSLRIPEWLFTLSSQPLRQQFILYFIFVNWSSVTNGYMGVAVAPAVVFGYSITDSVSAYYFILFFVVISTIFVRNVVNSQVGRALIAVSRERSHGTGDGC